MSRGYGGFAKLISQDDKCVTYAYGGYDWSIPECSNPNYERDGIITIDKSCFVEPKITKSIELQPDGSEKVIYKREPVRVDFGPDVDAGRITGTLSKYDLNSPKPNRTITILLIHIFKEYQEQGDYPKDTCFFC